MTTKTTLSKGQRRFLSRNVCAWCHQQLSRDTCAAMYGNEHCTPELRAKRRADCLKTYKPRAA